MVEVTVEDVIGRNPKAEPAAPRASRGVADGAR
jgi:hypothetical protein